jgi:hypothetical protein
VLVRSSDADVGLRFIDAMGNVRIAVQSPTRSSSKILVAIFYGKIGAGDRGRTDDDLYPLFTLSSRVLYMPSLSFHRRAEF